MHEMLTIVNSWKWNLHGDDFYFQEKVLLFTGAKMMS